MKTPLSEFSGLNVTFNTGEACNLACTYCYEVNKKQTRLPLEYAKRFIDILLSETDIVGLEGSQFERLMHQGLILDFIGGDSLMDPKLLEDIMDYFKMRTRLLRHRWRDNWRISISTNGTLFGREDVRSFLEKYKETVSLSISVDGCPAIHDKNRPFPDGSGSMKVIEEHLPWLKDYVGCSRLSTKSTLNKDSIPYLFESLKYMVNLGFIYINQNFIFEDMGLSEEDYKLLDEQMALCVDYMLTLDDSIYWGMIDKRFLDATNYETNCAAHPNTGWCGSGAMPALSVEGKIYPCFRFLPHTQGSGVDMSVGDIWEGITRKENFACIRSKTREVISPEKCKSCDIESACSWCIAGSYSERGEGFRQTYICDITKMQAKWAKIYWSRRETNLIKDSTDGRISDEGTSEAGCDSCRVPKLR